KTRSMQDKTEIALAVELLREQNHSLEDSFKIVAKQFWDSISKYSGNKQEQTDKTYAVEKIYNELKDEIKKARKEICPSGGCKMLNGVIIQVDTEGVYSNLDSGV
ncbi:hypothetical protein ACFLQJ_03270, partial [Calditrichota bacterium]